MARLIVEAGFFDARFDGTNELGACSASERTHARSDRQTLRQAGQSYRKPNLAVAGWAERSKRGRLAVPKEGASIRVHARVRVVVRSGLVWFALG